MFEHGRCLSVSDCALESAREVSLESPSITHLTATEVAQLDPYVFLRKMAWLMPRLQRAVPYLGYLLVVGEKPATAQKEAGEMAEGMSPERMS